MKYEYSDDERAKPADDSQLPVACELGETPHKREKRMSDERGACVCGALFTRV